MISGVCRVPKRDGRALADLLRRLRLRLGNVRWTMGLREFKDSDGVLWQVWTVTADVLDKRTAAEDYMRDWQDGWLCFEHSGARRRLAQFPADWETLADDKLQLLLDQAQAVTQRKRGSTRGEDAVTGDQASPPPRRPSEGDRSEPTPP